MKGAQILSMLDQGLRLSRPPRCPESVYGVMQACWNFEGVRRPTFAELVLTMSRLAMKGPLMANFDEKSSTSPSRHQSGSGSGTNSGGDFAFF